MFMFRILCVFSRLRCVKDQHFGSENTLVEELFVLFVFLLLVLIVIFLKCRLFTFNFVVMRQDNKSTQQQ